MVNYALIAQMATRPISDYSMVPIIGSAVQEGHIGTVLLRPMDWQGWNFTDVLADVVYKHVCFSIPQAVIAWLWMGLTLPTDFRVWLPFGQVVYTPTALLTGATMPFTPRTKWLNTR